MTLFYATSQYVVLGDDDGNVGVYDASKLLLHQPETPKRICGNCVVVPVVKPGPDKNRLFFDGSTVHRLDECGTWHEYDTQTGRRIERIVFEQAIGEWQIYPVFIPGNGVIDITACHLFNKWYQLDDTDSPHHHRNSLPSAVPVHSILPGPGGAVAAVYLVRKAQT